ncbi:flavodoxin [Enterococcus pingfangensis]|uniref:flavodoxin n=1 Tax=Enterococcus pingfangensis TaxID=2559924 RepID=UPI0027D96DB6|nr:flavodoxin [Enterococcus pingfangensis]
MKRIIVILTTIGALIAVFIGAAIVRNTNEKEPTMKNSKTLIVYYSRTGNTKAVAELIQEKVGGDLVQIETKEARPANYQEEVAQNEQEQTEQIVPELKTNVAHFDSYDRIFIGAPTWNMALPQAVTAFLSEYDFAGKTVVPFNTHGGYGVGSVFSQIEKGTNGADVLEGISIKGGEETKGVLLAIKGNEKNKVSNKIDAWLKEIQQQ